MASAAKKVASNRVVVPPAPAPQGESEWGPTATQPAAQVEATATETKTEAQPPVTANTEAAPVVPPAPAPPATDVHEEEAPVEIVSDEYEAKTPDTFADSLKELARVQALPERTGGQAKRKEQALLKIQRHVHEIQQGTPAPNLTATDRKQSDATTRHAEQVQWENLCRQYPLVKRFNDAYEALVEENNNLRQQITAK